MDNGTLEEAAAVVRRVELLAMSGAKDQAKREAGVAFAAITAAVWPSLGWLWGQLLRKPGEMHLAGEDREGIIRLLSSLARIQQASTANDEHGVSMSGEQLSLNADD